MDKDLNNIIKNLVRDHLQSLGILNIVDGYIGKFREPNISRLNALQQFIINEIEYKSKNLPDLIYWAENVSPKSFQLATKMAVELSTIYCRVFNKKQPRKIVKSKPKLYRSKLHHMCHYCANHPDDNFICKYDKTKFQLDFYTIPTFTRAFKELAYKNEHEVLIRGREMITKLRELKELKVSTESKDVKEFKKECFKKFKTV